MFDVVCTTVNGGIPIFYRKISKMDSVSVFKHDDHHLLIIIVCCEG